MLEKFTTIGLIQVKLKQKFTTPIKQNSDQRGGTTYRHNAGAQKRKV